MFYLKAVNTVISILFFACYFYQLVYLLIPLFKRDRPHAPEVLHRYAVLIAARNEEAVIGNLIESIKGQDYPSELVSVFVAADNCTDGTALAARRAGATVYERFDRERVGKGYALDFLLRRIEVERGDVFDAYLVFDADNLLSPGYITAMNRMFSDGHPIVTSYRNSKNFGDNWISAGYALWFLRDAEFLNHPRALLGSSAVVSGTGFLVSREIIARNGGWPFHSLTEDTEFTADCMVRGDRIGYAPDAELFDEQPVKFSQSWRQRMRWSRGFLQVFRMYGGRLLSGAAHGSFSCFDMVMSIMPAIILASVGFAVNTAASVLALLSGGTAWQLAAPTLQSILGTYLFMLFIGGVTTVKEWRHIHTPAAKKVLYTLTFPFFMMTYIPISIAAIFRKVEWKPIEHKVNLSIRDLT